VIAQELKGILLDLDPAIFDGADKKQVREILERALAKVKTTD